MSDVKITLPAGRYFVGDVAGVARPWVAIPARASVFYSDCGVEVEIAGGASSGFVDENAFGVFGVVDFDSVAEIAGDEFENGSFGCFELTSTTEIIFDYDYLEIVGVMKFSVARDAGLKFTDTDEAFENASPARYAATGRTRHAPGHTPEQHPLARSLVPRSNNCIDRVRPSSHLARSRTSLRAPAYLSPCEVSHLLFLI